MPGTYEVTLIYRGDALVRSGTGTAPLVVKKATPNVTGTDTTVAVDESTTMRVRVTAPGVVPTGRVTLRVGDVVLGTGELTNGVTNARIRAGRLPASATPYDVTIAYSGDDRVRGGTGTAQLRVTR